jgi:hypothetical protein
MKNFSSYITEESIKTLSIFDIDDTLFRTSARVYVKKDNKIIKKLTNKQFNAYKLNDSESFDFAQFNNAKLFNQTSTPIGHMIGKLKGTLKQAGKNGSRVIFITARADFDDKDLFLDTFRAYDIDIDKIYVERAGNFEFVGSSAKKKKFLFKKYLTRGGWKRVRFFDDHMDNITTFKALGRKIPDVDFEAWHVKPNGIPHKV